jgi:RHS repeat-associated protein
MLDKHSHLRIVFDSAEKVNWISKVWEKPFSDTTENNEKFVGKEKDKETGLYYFRARYMRPEIGRFISPDPMGPVDPRTSKTNEKLLLNPQQLNRYAYSLNNPYRYIDITGKWAEDVHSGIGNFKYGTYIWARQVGFSDREARLIATGNVSTDKGPWTNWLPWYLFGDQSRHFNQPYLFSSNVENTLDYWADIEFRRGLRYWKKGKYKAALGHLGKGLHSLQDKYAHRNWDTGILEKRRHPDWYDDWNDPRNKEAAEATRKATIEYFRKFLEFTK